MTTTFLTGPAGTGKTTQAVARLRQMLADNVPANTILVIVPQLTLAQPYRQLLQDPTLPGAGMVDVLTMNGLAWKTIDLFWPLGATAAGFGRPHARPVFLTIETAQYYLYQVIQPLLQQGYFDPNVVPVTISLPRLMSQILDNLNKAALIGLPHTDVGQRLAASTPADPGNRVALEHTQACVNQFRQFCLERNLLDFSLRIETFHKYLWPVTGVQLFLTGRYRHLIVDNVEEDTPFAHTILTKWLPHTDSALLVNDEDAGFRIFLGANWRTGHALSTLCQETTTMTTPHAAVPAMVALGHNLSQIIFNRIPPSHLSTWANDQMGQFANARMAETATDQQQMTAENAKPTARPPFTFEQKRFYPQMVDWVIEQIATLVKEGVSPGQIVVLAPFVSDALRFSFIHRMGQRGLKARSHRPSRPLSEEPAAKTMLTLARLAFPHWGLLPDAFDITHALSHAIAGLDLIRANLLTKVVYHQRAMNNEQGAITQSLISNPQSPISNLQSPISNLQSPISSFDQIEGTVRERISYDVGNRFDTLREWLLALDPAQPPVLDHFFNRLFGELLSKPGFGFYRQAEAGQIVANLADSARQFRQVAGVVPLHAHSDALPTVDQLNRAFLETIQQGIAAAQYIRSWEPAPEQADDDAVLITPATTFLMGNRAVDYQFWLDAGSSGWWERIAQPLTHPYILAADWPHGQPWTDAEEVAAQHDRLYRLVLGLTRRCRQHIFITNAEVGEQGYEQRGQLLMVFQQMLRRAQQTET